MRSDSVGGVARVQVSDDGPGIPDSDLPRVFDRFFRARNSRDNHDGAGSGLGLTIAARLALRHGGRLTAANNPEGGAVFTLELPLRREVGPGTSPQARDTVKATESAAPSGSLNP